jgi:hypothetical protein
MEFSRDELIVFVLQLHAERKTSHESIAELGQQVEQCRKPPATHGADQEYSLKAEEW